MLLYREQASVKNEINKKMKKEHYYDSFYRPVAGRSGRGKSNIDTVRPIRFQGHDMIYT